MTIASWSSRFYTSWTEQEHAVHFDGLRYVPSWLLQRRLEGFNEIQLLREVLAPGRPITILEIGCATGELFRYVRRRHPGVAYIGADISQPAIARAQEKFGDRGRFVVTDPELGALDGTKAEVVFSRDVVHHQTNPWSFLERLYRLAGEALIVRLRTRDRGPTETDPEKSCQFHAGHWIPYIIMSCDELIETVRAFRPAPARVRLLKDLVVLGGVQGRYLPKACYDALTGTAESALLLVKTTGEGPQTMVEVEVRPDGERSPGWSRLKWACRLGSMAVRGVVGRGYRGRTRW